MEQDQNFDRNNNNQEIENLMHRNLSKIAPDLPTVTKQCNHNQKLNRKPGNHQLNLHVHRRETKSLRLPRKPQKQPTPSTDLLRNQEVATTHKRKIPSFVHKCFTICFLVVVVPKIFMT
jgi:hypothetical protein